MIVLNNYNYNFVPGQWEISH